MSKIRKYETISFRLEKCSQFRVKLRKKETKNNNFGLIYRTFKLQTGLELLQIIAILAYALV